jgi:hypothetical protein
MTYRIEFEGAALVQPNDALVSYIQASQQRANCPRQAG